jgi:capsular exopolysaccharide synthesis family protein
LHTFFHPKTSWSESFRAIRTALFFSNQRCDSKVIQVTSAVPGEGKSTIACNLAISIAQSGKSVLLIDADLRRPRVSQIVGIECERGFAWLLDEMKEREIRSSDDVTDLLGEVVHETPTENLSVIVAGDRPQDPAEMLASSRLDLFLECVRDRFDLIIIDTPPLLAVTDPSNVAPRVDSVLMVIRLNKNARPNAARAIRMLETLEANVTGVIVNGVGSRHAGRYGAYDGRDGYYNGGYYKYGAGYSYGSGGSGRFSEYYEDSVPGTAVRRTKRLTTTTKNGTTVATVDTTTTDT